jgi:hypothetical protein
VGFRPRPLVGSARLEPGVDGIAKNWVASGPLGLPDGPACPGLKPLAVGASVLGARLEPGVGDIAMNWVAPEPLAVVATAGRPELALLVESDMI